MLYELVTILISGNESEKIERINSLIAKNGAQIVNQENWGEKKFTYPLKKQSAGIYVYSEIEIEPKNLILLTRELKLDEDILRFLIVKKPKIKQVPPSKRKVKKAPVFTPEKPTPKAITEKIVTEEERLKELDKKLDEILKE